MTVHQDEHPVTQAGRAPVIDVRSVSITLGNRLILNDISLEIWPGEVLAIVGPNGAGKSTLLSLIAGDREPDSGQVLLDGMDLHQLKPVDQSRRRAVLLQENHTSFPFTAQQVVAMGRRPWRGTFAERHDDTVTNLAMTVTDVNHLADRTFPTLSGGEKARTSYARTLAQGTLVHILDEPTAALDIHHQELVLAQAQRHARSGMAVVVVLHDLTSAAAYADRVVVLHHGKIAAVGVPHEVMTAPLLTKVYEHPVEVIERPDGSGLIIVPIRTRLGGKS